MEHHTHAQPALTLTMIFYHSTIKEPKKPQQNKDHLIMRIYSLHTVIPMHNQPLDIESQQEQYQSGTDTTHDMALNDRKYYNHDDVNNVGTDNKKHGQRNTFLLVLVMIILVYCYITMPIYIGLAYKDSVYDFITMCLYSA